MADWMDGEVEAVPDVSLTNAQIFAFLRMAKVLRDTTNLNGVYAIKVAIEDADYQYAEQLWMEFTEDEQTALWVAPKFGGIFTTEERKIIKGGFK